MKGFFRAIFLVSALIAVASAASCIPSTFKLMAGQSIEVGSVSITNSESALEVSLQLSNGWTMSEVHVYAGNSAPETVAPGQFPFSRTLSNPSSSFTAVVPLPSGSDCTSTFSIAVHAVVSNGDQTETAWAQGSHAFTGARWGWWAYYTAQCGCGDLFPGTNDTNSGNITQCCACPVSPSSAPSAPAPTCAPFVTKVFGGQTLYALDLVITNTLDSLTITVSNVSSWSFGVVHIYIGNGPIPSAPNGTPIPGQFPFQISFASNVQSWSNTWSIDQLNATLGGFVPSCGSSFYILTHFELHGPSQETGWGFGSIPFSSFGSPRWGWAMNYTWCCAQPPRDPENDGGCTYTQGYWKNHNDFSPRPSQHIAWPIDEHTQLCDKTWLSILQTPVKGSKWLILAHQWIASKLNVANGADATVVAETLIEAENILNTCTLSDADARRAPQLASILDDYNNGVTGPGHCDEAKISTDVCGCRCPVQEDAEEKHKAKLPRFRVDSNEPRQTLKVANQKKINALLNKATKVHFTAEIEEGSSGQLTVICGNNDAKYESSGSNPSIEVDSDSADSFIVSVSSPDGSSIMGAVSVSYDVPADSNSGNGNGAGNGGVSPASSVVASASLVLLSLIAIALL